MGRDSFGDLFGHIRMVYRKSKPQGTLLKEFNTHVREHHAPRDVIDKILIPMAQVFEQLTDAAYTSTEGAQQVNTSLRWLNRLVFNDWVSRTRVLGAAAKSICGHGSVFQKSRATLRIRCCLTELVSTNALSGFAG